MRRQMILPVLGLLLAWTTEIAAFSSPPTWPERYADDNEANLRDPQAGWQVLQDDYTDFHFYDGLSFEWDYYSIHDNNGNFTGIIGYLVMDPRGHLGGGTHFWTPNLMPSGGNLAIYGRVKDDQDNYSRKVNFVNFGLETEASADYRFWESYHDNGDWGRLEPEDDGMRLQGQTADFAWDLLVTQAFGPGDVVNYDLFPETWEIGNDLDSIPGSGEHWTVNPLWLTTYVTGEITDLSTGEVMDIDGHGYRENSFGRWAFITGGWDFWFHSDMENRVGFSLQTYHFNTEDLDWMDITFTDNGTPKAVRFHARDGHLGWQHDEWAWDSESRQAVPKDIHIVGKNRDYTVVVKATIERQTTDGIELDYIPMLSAATPVTDLYTIQSLFPTFEGTIYRNKWNGDTNYNDVVVEFGGIGGGEFSMARSAFPNLNPNLVEPWLNKTFSKPFPK